MMKQLFLLLIFLSSQTKAQFKGIWNGYLTEEGKTLKSYYILDIKEQFEDIIKGDTYVYRTNYISFLGKMNFIGTIENGKLNLSELKLLINKRPITQEYFCFKNMLLERIDKDSIKHLTGPWLGAIYNSEPCSPGEVFLRKIEPNDDNKFEPIPEHILDEINQKSLEPDSFLTTKLSIPRIINVQSKKVNIKIKDYDKIDGDIISVYLNRNIIINKFNLKRQGVEKRLPLDPNSEINELIIFANNLGKIPPNTCMMIVDDGITQQEIYITSSLQQSALLYLRYQNKKP
nr:hypothetical protein [Pseudopedobacter sp.]